MWCSERGFRKAVKLCDFSVEYLWALQELIRVRRSMQRMARKYVASIRRRVLRHWATTAQYLRLHRMHHDSLGSSSLLGAAGHIATAWHSLYVANQLRASLLQRRALHAWTSRTAEKAFWRCKLAHICTVMQQAACIRYFLAWREHVLSMHAKLAAFARKQRALRSALAAGRALARLHHSELLAACMHAWHARVWRRLRAHEALHRAKARTMSRCWQAWVEHTASARALYAVQCAIESSRRCRTFRRVLNAWRGVVLVSEQAREEATAPAVLHMHLWRGAPVC